MPNPPVSSARRRTVERWETVAVTALPPGWRNTFMQDDGSAETGTCPAILLQELREVTVYRDDPLPAGGFKAVADRVDVKEPPFETRAVFADYDSDGGELAPVMDTSNYGRTLAPGEEPAAPKR